VATGFIIAAAVIGMLFGFFLASILYTCNYTQQRHYQDLSQKIFEMKTIVTSGDKSEC
jgi:hypothetical protein